MSEFLIVLRGNFSEWKNKTPEEIESLMQKYNSWVEELGEKEILLGGSELTGESKFLSVNSGEIKVSDGPYTETKECLTGYFIIKAANLSEATEIAKGCPALTHGETVEVLVHRSEG